MRNRPVVIPAIVTGLLVLVAGGWPWMLLARLNSRMLVSVPWAILPMAMYLWFYWRYLDGAGWPRETAEIRRANLRANRLSGDVWSMSMIAGLIGFGALFPFLGVMGRLVRLPAETESIVAPPGMPVITMFVLLVMASGVAGVAEEAAFRGYMQGPIERRYGPAVAIVVNGTLFGLAHFTHHPAAVLSMLPYYIAVAAIYGGLAFATNSILPGLMLHAGGDVFSLTRLWTTGRAEWQVSREPVRLIWETGVDTAFVSQVVALVLIGAAAVWAYKEVARAARSTGHDAGSARLSALRAQD